MKHGRGKSATQTWVLGIVERHTGKIILVPVPDRKRKTLLPIIKKYEIFF